MRNTLNYKDAIIYIENAIEQNDTVAWYYVEAVVSAYALKNLELTKKYADKALTFGETNLGSSNYNYIVDIINNLQGVEYNLYFKFNPDNKNLIY